MVYEFMMQYNALNMYLTGISNIGGMFVPT